MIHNFPVFFSFEQCWIKGSSTVQALPNGTYFDRFESGINEVSSGRESFADLPAKDFFRVSVDGILVDDVFAVDGVERFVVVGDATLDELGVGQQSEPVRDVA